MFNLYAPWRSNYSQSTDKSKDENTSEQECIFCQQLQENNDTKNFILKRYKHCFVVLNKYPYNAGHLLVVPYAHAKSLADLDAAARTELMDIITATTALLQKELRAQGINIGLNLGKASGAGIPSHLHFHVLPRWIGDTNFLPALADTKVVSLDLVDLFNKLKTFFK
jgi:ATP adenylyltransferase